MSSSDPSTTTAQVDILVREIHVLETEIRTTLRSSSQTANLSMLIIAVAAGAGTAQGFGPAAFSALPVFLTVVALANLNSAIDVAQLAEQRDWLSARANQLVKEPIFVTGDLARFRRSSRSGVSVNLLSTAILAASIAGGVWIARDQPWFIAQLIISAGLITLCFLSLSDFLSIRRRTRRSLEQLETSRVAAKTPEPPHPDSSPSTEDSLDA